MVHGILTAALAVPIAWVSTAGALHAGAATAVGLIIIAQVGVLAGANAWPPLAAPELWAMRAGSAVTLTQLKVLGGPGLRGTADTLHGIMQPLS